MSGLGEQLSLFSDQMLGQRREVTVEEILGLLEPVGDIQRYDGEHPHPDARPDWRPGTDCTDTPDWACQVCGKPYGH